VLPTFVSLAGGKVKKDIKIDGMDVSKWMLGKTETSPRNTWHYFQGTRLQAVRQGPWKLAITGQSLGMGIRQRDADLAKGGRLYNLEKEIGEKTNLAKENPDIVEKLQKIAAEIAEDIAANKRPAGTVQNPVTLYPSTSRKRPAKKPTKPAKPIDWNKAKLGQTYPSASAPAIVGKSFSFLCTLEANQPYGIILAHGGSAVGYVLYAKDGKLTFAIRHSTERIQRVTFESPPGNAEIVARHTAAKFSIQIGDQEIAVKAHDLLRRHPLEDLCIGHDDRNPVDPEAPKGRINGKLTGLKVVLGK
jgi:hypothetical protein